MYPSNSKKRRGETFGYEGKGKKAVARRNSKGASVLEGKGGSFSERSGNPKPAGSRRGGKNRNGEDSQEDSSYHVSIPLSSASSSTHFGSNADSLSQSLSHFPAEQYTTSLVSSSGRTDAGLQSDSGVHYNRNNWQAPASTVTTVSSISNFNGSHSPIAYFSPHSSPTFTSFSQNNEDISIQGSSSLPYYYPQDWNRGTPEWNRVDSVEWNRSDFASNSSIGIPTNYSMDTNPNPELSPSFISLLDEPLNHDVNHQTSTVNSDTSTSTMTHLARALDGTSSGRTQNIATVDSVLFGELPTEGDDRNQDRMMHVQRGSSGQHRRQGISYSVDQHHSILQELLSENPSSLQQRSNDSPLSNRRTASARPGQNDSMLHDILTVDYPTRRRSARVRSGRSELDVLQHRPILHEPISSSVASEFLGSGSATGLPLDGLDDLTELLSAGEHTSSEIPRGELESNGRRASITDMPLTTISEDADVITISSDEEPDMVNSERRRSAHRHRRQPSTTGDGVGPSTIRVDRDAEYARRLQEELYSESPSSFSRPESTGSFPVYPPNLHPWSPGMYYVPNMDSLNHSASRYMRDNRDLLAARIHNWSEGGARRFIASAMSNSRRRGQRRPVSRSAMMSHISRLPPALLLSSLIGSSTQNEMGYEELLELADRLGSAKFHGLKKEEIEKLSTRVYKGKTSSDSSSCVICMSDYEAGDKLRVLLCSHEFHIHCVDQWLKENQTCPICRLDTKPPS